jgi:tetratricopeptide (TPR) repeat protein
MPMIRSLISFSAISFALAFPSPALSLVDRTTVQCGFVSGEGVVDSSINVICGMTPREFAENMRLALSSNNSDRQELFRRLELLIPEDARLQANAIREFFSMLSEQPLPAAELQERLAEIASRHLALIEQVNRLHVDDPEVQTVRTSAAAALEAETPDYETAAERLAEARDMLTAKREFAETLFIEHQREEAELVRTQAQLEVNRLRFAEAARLFEQASMLRPDGDHDARFIDALAAIDAWQDQASSFGDLIASQRAVDLAGELENEFNREEAPRKWAIAKYTLGRALRVRSAWDDDLGILVEALSAIQSALTELTAEDDALTWARAQNLLGNIQSDLADREGQIERYQEAIAAYQNAESALDQNSYDWANIQMNIGNILADLGRLEENTEIIREAVIRQRRALATISRERNPSDWSLAQGNLAISLYYLGRSERDASILFDAITAYQSNLELTPVEYYPLDVARIRYNMGYALWAMGNIENNTDLLREAIQSLREAEQLYANTDRVMCIRGRCDRSVERSRQAIEAIESDISGR